MSKQVWTLSGTVLQGPPISTPPSTGSDLPRLEGIFRIVIGMTPLSNATLSTFLLHPRRRIWKKGGLSSRGSSAKLFLPPTSTTLPETVKLLSLISEKLVSSVPISPHSAGGVTFKKISKFLKLRETRSTPPSTSQVSKQQKRSSQPTAKERPSNLLFGKKSKSKRWRFLAL